MKALLDSDLAVYVVAIGAAVVGIIVVLVPVVVVDAWDTARGSLAAATCFFALVALITALYKGEYSPASLFFIFAPALLAELFLGVLLASSMTLLVSAFDHFLEEHAGAVFVIMLIAMLPIAMLREVFRRMDDGKPPRLWAMTLWLAPSLLLQSLLHYRPDLIRIPPV